MNGRGFFCILLAVSALAAGATKTSITGRLLQNGGAPALETAQGKISLLADEDTTSVLKDHRLAGMDVEVVGHMSGPGQFKVDPSYTKNLFVHKDGKRLMVTYWCPVCSIRTYKPGECMCCHQETHLDLRDPDEL